MSDDVFKSGGRVIKLELEPELVFTEGDLKVLLAPIRGVPHVTLPRSPRGLLTAVLHQKPGTPPEIIAFFSSEGMARVQTQMAWEGFRALSMLFDAARALTASLDAPEVDREKCIAAIEGIETSMAEAGRVLARGAELADKIGEPEGGH